MKLIEIASKDGILLQECLSNCFCSSDKVFWDCIAKINLKKCLKSDCFVKALFVDASFGQRRKTMLNRKNLPHISKLSTWFQVKPASTRGTSLLHPNIRKKHQKIFSEHGISEVKMCVADVRFQEPNIGQIVQKMKKIKKIPQRIPKNKCVHIHKICSIWKVPKSHEIVTHHNKGYRASYFVGEKHVHEFIPKLCAEQIKDIYMTINFSFKIDL